MVGVVDIDGEEPMEEAEIVVLLVVVTDSWMFHPTTAIAPTVDELTVSVLVAVFQAEPSSVYAHVPL